MKKQKPTICYVEKVHREIKMCGKVYARQTLILKQSSRNSDIRESGPQDHKYYQRHGRAFYNDKDGKFIKKTYYFKYVCT